ncbi:glycosyltransferase family 39 protein [Lacinutrix neustonica]|uniref:Glycosyltransferase family 39 protein n=1 Tax=Lacinutrix neustonica TaxID=2980107 RepID=A0A9E8MZL4_9FLAO|nr:glycosyltransferase family 39 protein [Lacinutrix neustonica]WAC03789.1 glycosyltransferase family 39 protein [Lacinutrix neustonica]
MIRFFKKHQDQFGLLLLWLAIIAIINPMGDFPLNDDWCYGKSVKTLREEGYLKLYNWGEMTLVGHVYWGYFFTKLFGFSFTVLRWSTLLMGFATILGIYELFKLARVSRWMNLFGTVLCMMNPIFLSLSFSFMTDVPFYCMTIWCFYFYAKAIKTESWHSIFWAIFFCCWAFLIRQLAWVFPVVWLITVLLTKKRTLENIAKAMSPLFVLIIFAMLFSYFMESHDLLQERYNSKFKLLLESIRNIDIKLIILILSYFFRCLAYIGFLLAPISIFYISRYTFKGYKIWALIWTVLITSILIKIGKVLPSLDNIWIDFGVGPTTLHDHAGNFTTSPAPHAPELFWLIVTTIGVFSSIALLFHIRGMVVSVFNKITISPIVLLSFVFFTVYLTPFLLVGVYDRYLLPLFPIAIVFLAANSQEIPKLWYQYMAFGFLGALTWFSVCATHDYLSWNRVRWNAINGLMDSEFRRIIFKAVSNLLRGTIFLKSKSNGGKM